MPKSKKLEEACLVAKDIVDLFRLFAEGGELNTTPLGKAMAVGLKVKYNWYQIGEADFLYAFFSTIAYNLENKNWGSRFPAIMDDLYQGKVDYCNIDAAEKQLLAIKEELKGIPANKIVWDIDDVSKSPPWGTNISSDIKNLSNYFLTSDGEDMFETFFRAIDAAKSLKANLEIKKL